MSTTTPSPVGSLPELANRKIEAAEMIPPVKPGDVVVLENLKRQINKAHSDLVEAARGTLVRIWALGDLLIKAKAEVPHGGWLKWIEQNCKVSERSAQLYVRLTEGRSLIEAKIKADIALGKSATVADLSVRGAQRLLGPEKKGDGEDSGKASPDLRELVIQRLVAIAKKEGDRAAKAQAAAVVEVMQETNWID